MLSSTTFFNEVVNSKQFECYFHVGSMPGVGRVVSFLLRSLAVSQRPLFLIFWTILVKWLWVSFQNGVEGIAVVNSGFMRAFFQCNGKISVAKEHFQIDVMYGVMTGPIIFSIR